MSGIGALRAIWRMKWLAAAILLVFLGVTAGVTALLPQVFQATATVRVIPAGQTADTFSQLQANQALARTYAELLRSPNVYTEAVQRGNLSVSAEALAESTTISYVEGTELVQIQIEARDPGEASGWANTIAETFVEERGEDGGGERLVIADPAPVPSEPVSPSWPLNLALGLLLGTMAALGGVLLLDFFGDRIYSPEEVEKIAGAPILGTLPTLKLGKRKDKEVARDLSTYEEAVRTLRVSLNFALGDSSGKGVILITSALPGEGKTTVASYLAESYARAQRRCLLIDADLRRPQLHAQFSLRNLRGLSNLLLEGPGNLSETAFTMPEVPGLAVLTSGPIPPNPADLLGLGETKVLLRFMRERFDTMILDSPPAQGLADASILSAMSDGVILVVDAGDARRRALSRTVEQLRGSKARILGVVLNNASEKELASHSYSDG